MNKGFRSFIIILAYLIIYFASDLLVGVFAGVIYGIKNAMNVAQEISSETLTTNVQQFYLRNINVFIVLSFIIATLIYLLIFKIKGRSFKDYINIGKLELKDAVFCCLLGIGISLFLSSFLMLTSIHELFPVHGEIVETIVGEQSFIVSLMTVGILIPIFEEILFRGLIFNRLINNHNITIAIILQAFIFGIVHGNVLQFSYTFIGGIVLALVYVWLKSIWAPILVHMLWNSISIALGWFNAGGQLSYLIISVISMGVIIVSIYKIWLNRKSEVDEIIVETEANLN